MEDALPDDRPVTILRPGAIYGPFDHPYVLREWYLVGRVARGERVLQLPDGGTQLFHRVAIDRVGRAVAAALDRAPGGSWACNVADRRTSPTAASPRLVAERFGWEWEPEPVAWEEGDHPWNVRHPVFTDTTRLRETLGVTAPTRWRRRSPSSTGCGRTASRSRSGRRRVMSDAATAVPPTWRQITPGCRDLGVTRRSASGR